MKTNTSVYIPYTYYLFHKPTGLKYYGARYASRGSRKSGIANPSDLWTTYFTSSSRVKLLIEEYGAESFVVEVRRTFDTAQEALDWEFKVLSRLNVNKRSDWLNCNIGGKMAPSLEGIERMRQYNLTQREYKRGHKLSEETITKMRVARNKRTSSGMKGRSHSTDTKARVSESLKGISRSDETRAKMASRAKGRKKFIREDGSWTWVYPSESLDC